MKNIYKDEVIGNINSNLIYNNEIRGVFGEIVDISEVPRDNPNNPNIVTNQQIIDEYLYTYNLLSDTQQDNNFSRQAENSFVFDFLFDFRFNYNTPIENTAITARLYYDEYYFTQQAIDNYGSLLHTQTNLINNWLIQNRDSISRNQMLDTYIDIPPILPQFQITPIQKYLDFEILNKNIQPFIVEFSCKLNKTIKGGFSAGSYQLGTVPLVTFQLLSTINSIQPKYIEITVRGDTYRITPQAFQYGSKENAFEQSQSTILTTKATYQNRPLWEHIGQRITIQWENGKQVVNLPTIINSEEDIKEVNEETYVFNVRRGEIDESNQNQVNNASIFKTLDGTAKKFIIVNITNNYDGSFSQNLDLQEVIE